MDEDAKAPAGAILSDQQIARLKVAVIVMTAVLVIGVITLIGRIIYLASNRTDAATVAPASGSILKPEAAVALPPGHDVKSIGMSGNRLIVHHVGPTGDGVAILDLTTGQVVSRIVVRRSQ